MGRPFDLPAEVRRQIEDHGMLSPDGRGIVAVSGGADSAALLLALHELGYRPVVAHLDHGLRAESTTDAEFVRQLAGRLGLPFTVERRDVAAYRREQRLAAPIWPHGDQGGASPRQTDPAVRDLKARKLSLETAAREVRHGFLRDVAAREGATAIFLGHTADDQVETFLLRLIRGAGVAGLGGMRPRDGVLCRPMLALWRSEIEGFLRDRGEAWREDASNRDPRFLRNRVRHELLPLLATMNPGVARVLLREAGVLARRQGDIEAEVLRRFGLSARQIETALTGEPVTLKDGWRLLPPGEHRPASSFDLRLPVPGEVRIPGIGTLAAELAELPVWEAPPADASRLLPHVTEYVDGARIDSGLRIRTRRRGDRFVPLGMQSPKKLQDFFVDAHVPRDRRDSVPLVTSGDAIVWVAGLRLDERFKITGHTKQAIKLRFGPSTS
jgi:tRNA(Ile)-lysidine synthase